MRFIYVLRLNKHISNLLNVSFLIYETSNVLCIIIVHLQRFRNGPKRRSLLLMFRKKFHKIESK